MRQLNYNHLLYFWTVAGEGSLARASKVLHLTPQTISEQLKALEAAIGEPLFVREGRRQVLTETGQFVYRYAEEIFALGSELTEQLRARRGGVPAQLRVGVKDSVAKLVACRILEGALSLEEPPRLHCAENSIEGLLADLAAHRLDLVLTDEPPSPGSEGVHGHLLGESGIAFFAVGDACTRLRRDFPDSLHGASVALPDGASALRRKLDEWFDVQGIVPHVVAEIADLALLEALGAAGLGAFPGPAVIEQAICRQYGVKLVGRIDDIRECYYLVCREHRLEPPALLALAEAARFNVFTASRTAQTRSRARRGASEASKRGDE